MQKRNILTLGLVSMLMVINLTAQGDIALPYVENVVVDGHISADEWMGAYEIVLEADAGMQTTVYLCHDDEALTFAFAGNLESADVLFPEIFLDGNNNNSTSWDANDWWFHVSATDCESVGMPFDFSNCQVEHDDWEAVPNIESDSRLTDTVEIRIPIQKLGIADLTTGIGIMVRLTNILNTSYQWPADATVGDPSTWTEFVYENSVSVEGPQPRTFELSPNAASSKVCLSLSDNRIVEYVIVDNQGKVWGKGTLSNRVDCLDIAGYTTCH